MGPIPVRRRSAWRRSRRATATSWRWDRRAGAAGRWGCSACQERRIPAAAAECRRTHSAHAGALLAPAFPPCDVSIRRSAPPRPFSPRSSPFSSACPRLRCWRRLALGTSISWARAERGAPPPACAALVGGSQPLQPACCASAPAQLCTTSCCSQPEGCTPPPSDDLIKRQSAAPVHARHLHACPIKRAIIIVLALYLMKPRVNSPQDHFHNHALAGDCGNRLQRPAAAPCCGGGQRAVRRPKPRPPADATPLPIDACVSNHSWCSAEAGGGALLPSCSQPNALVLGPASRYSKTCTSADSDRTQRVRSRAALACCSRRRSRHRFHAAHFALAPCSPLELNGPPTRTSQSTAGATQSMAWRPLGSAPCQQQAPPLPPLLPPEPVTSGTPKRYLEGILGEARRCLDAEPGRLIEQRRGHAVHARPVERGKGVSAVG